MLFGGQLLSSLGDEVNRVATVWLAARLWGAGAGRLLALHAFCACVSSLSASGWADRVPVRSLLVAADAARAVVVLCVPVGAAFGLPIAPLLLAAVAVCATLSAVFDPALRSLSASLIPSPGLRGPTNALMESTVRFARVMGPTLVATLSLFVPTIQLFTVDAATFVLSALSVAWLARVTIPSGSVRTANPVSVGIAATLREIGADRLLRFTLVTGGIVTAAWWLLLPLGMTLVLEERGAREVTSLAHVLIAYGVGNLTANLVVANFADRRPERLLFGGRFIAGCGFFLFAMAPNRPAQMAAAALAAMGGPLTDVGFIGALQARFEPSAIARVYRANLAVCYASMFALFFASPYLFRAFGATTVAAWAAVAIGACGGSGLVLFRNSTRPDRAASA